MTTEQVIKILTKYGLYPHYGPDDFLAKWIWVPEGFLGGNLLEAVRECKQIIENQGVSK